MSAALDAILAARRLRRILAPLGPDAPADVAAGYALQRELAEALGEWPPAGFKIGATARRMQDYLGLAEPAAAFVPAASCNPSPHVAAFADFLAPGVECEIAVRLAADLPPGPCDPARAGAAVGQVMAAIEIVERRYGDLQELGTPTLIADQVFHASGVLGPPVAELQGLDLAGLRGRILVDGLPQGEGRGADLLGHPLAALAWLAASPAAAVFGGLRAGQVVWLGSVTAPIWLEGPCSVEVEFEGLPPARLRLA
ncbi:MAG: fumarylacetoacetate hydrolase family protein [Rhodovarius sp.]|nr:fumarylacetoacetate hydrolase family protein [Rhodovarius sp.]